MELWIRSQSKEELIKVHNISINKDNYILGNLISDDNKSICDYWILGMYDTKERAFEVLDEIQNKLLKSKYDKAMEGYGKHTDCKDTLIEISSSTYVYEMPKE